MLGGLARTFDTIEQSMLTVHYDCSIDVSGEDSHRHATYKWFFEVVGIANTVV
jgi:hypothetical protein